MKEQEDDLIQNAHGERGNRIFVNSDKSIDDVEIIDLRGKEIDTECLFIDE